MHRSYADRRAMLEMIIREKPGYSMLAERTEIPMALSDLAVEKLETSFAKLLAAHQEGAVIKADESQYCDWSLRWIKVSVINWIEKVLILVA